MSNKLPWDSSFSVGNPTLDRQHRRLLELCNRLGDCLEDSGPGADSEFHDILNELAVYGREHFASEEAILARCGYAELAAQELEHAEYVQQVTEIITDAAFGQLDKVEAQRFLLKWWSGHILVSDMMYRGHIDADE